MPAKAVRITAGELGHILHMLPENAFVYLQSRTTGHGERVPYKGPGNTHMRVSGVLSGLQGLHGPAPVVIGDRTAPNCLHAYVDAVGLEWAGLLGGIVVLYVAPVLTVSADQLPALEDSGSDIRTVLAIAFPERM